MYGEPKIETAASSAWVSASMPVSAVEMPRSLEQAGVGRADFEAALPDLARAAIEDPSVRTNPRIPLVSELIELLEAGWRGRG